MAVATADTYTAPAGTALARFGDLGQAPPSTSTLVQYITHDGDAVGNTVTSSAPNRLYWNTVLEVPWARGSLGDWRDSAQAANGSAAYASFAAVTAVGRRTVAVTALVQRWLSNGLNRGFYLSSRANAFPLVFAGRTAATSGDRPELVVVTTAGTFNIPARANACWNGSSASVVSSAALWELRAFQQPAILQFSLSGVTGTLLSATLGITLTVLQQTGAIIDVFEADPPLLFDPATPTNPVSGIGALGGFDALRTHPSVLFADDFASPGPFDTGWAQTVTRAVDPERGTTYAESFIRTGTLAGADTRINIVNSLTAGGDTNPALRRDSAYATIRLRMESSFAGFADRVKIPAMGSQLGWWNSASGGYWQPVTGNGGFPGTGLKFINTAQGNRVEYHGHSSRFTTGYRCSDVSAYSDYVRLASYIYHLDQVGSFPTEDTIPGLVLKRGTWYDMSHFLELNTMSGAQDGVGNYATANADGVYRLWINGQQVYNRTNYRWRRHQEFCVQGFWVDVYHGGTNASDRDMYFRCNELAIASTYIGPVGVPIQLSGRNWTPNVDGSGNVLPTDYQQLPLRTWVRAITNKIDNLVPATFQPSPPNGRYGTTVSGADGLKSVTGAWSGAAWDYVRQAMLISGGGHADSWGTENGVYELLFDKMSFAFAVPRSAYNAAQYWDSGTSAFVAGTAPGGNAGPQIDGSMPAKHTYHTILWAPPGTFGSATKGYFVNYGLGLYVINLDTGAYLTPWYKSAQVKDFSYSTAFMQWPWMWSPGTSSNTEFAGERFRLDETETTTWNAASQGKQYSNFSSSSLIYSHRALCRMQQRGEIAIIGWNGSAITCARLRLDDAVATGGTSLTDLSLNYDSITLSGDTADFTRDSFLDYAASGGTPNYVFREAGFAYDSLNDCLWLAANTLGGFVYRITGLNSSSWVVTKYAGTETLSLSGLGSGVGVSNGTFGRFQVAVKNGKAYGLRVPSTLDYPEIIRLT